MISSLAKVAQFYPFASEIADHGNTCCRQARLWLTSMNKSHSYHGQRWHVPSWIRQHYKWGPVRWPLAWCQIPQSRYLDCGAFAAVSRYLLGAHEKVVLPVQLILQYPTQVTASWKSIWENEIGSSTWIAGSYCYHEACALFDQNEIKIWDPTEDSWLEPNSDESIFGALMAIRIQESLFHTESRPVTWNNRHVPYGKWIQIAGNTEGSEVA